MYKTSSRYKENIYKPSVQSAVNIYVDDILLNPKYLVDFKKGCSDLFGDNFELGSVPSQYVELKIHKKAGITNPKKIRIEYGILVNSALTVAEVNKMLVSDLNKLNVKSLSKYDNSFEMIPIGIYNVDDYKDEDGNSIQIKALDNIIKLDNDNGYYNAKELIDKKGYTTLGELAQDICNKKGLELESSSFINSDKKIAVYDDQITAREYMSYIAECAGGFCCATREGKISFRKIGQDETEVPLRLFKNYKFGEEYQISKVSYEDAIRSFKFGNETRNTLWITQDNLFIIDEDTVKNIYNSINGLTVNSFEGTVIIDPAVDIGDKIIVDGKPVIYQGEMSLNGRFISDIKSTISIAQRQETTVKKESQTIINRRVQSSIDQVNGKIELFAGEVEDLLKNASGSKSITIENCAEGNLLELHIYGNNTVFEQLYPSDTLYPSDNLYPMGDSRIIVKHEDNTTETYELGVTDVLRQNSETSDEYILKAGQAQVIRRVNKSGTTKAKESIEDLGEYHVKLGKGKNTITIENYTASFNISYAVQGKYTEMYATKVEVESSITQTADQINLEVKKKVDENEIISKINQSAEQISIEADKINLNGAVSANNNFKIDMQGNMEAKNGKFTGNIEIDRNNYLIANDLNGKKLMNLNYKGIDYFYNEKYVGTIGTDGSMSDDSKRGLTIGLSPDAYAFMLGRQETEDGGISQHILSWYNISTGDDGTLSANTQGKMQIGNKENGYYLGLYKTLYIHGNAYANSFNNVSLLKEKKNLEKMKNGAIEIVKDTELYRYNYNDENDGTKKHIGFIIDDNYKYSKEITSDSNNSADIYSMVSVAYKAIQEQQEMIEKQQKQIEELQKRLEEK